METLANCQLIFSGFLFYGGKLNHYVNWGNYIILMVALPNNTIRFSEAQMAKQILWAFLQSLRFGSNGFQKTDSKSLTPQYLWCTFNFEVVISNPIRKIQNSILLTILYLNHLLHRGNLLGFPDTQWFPWCCDTGDPPLAFLCLSPTCGDAKMGEQLRARTRGKGHNSSRLLEEVLGLT